MTAHSTGLAEIERACAAGAGGEPLSPAIERDFAAEIGLDRARVIRNVGTRLAVAYNLFLIMDVLLVPQTFMLVVQLHMIVTGMILCVARLFVQPRGRMHEALAAAIPLIIIAQILIVMACDGTPGAYHYQYVAILLVVYMNVNLRLDHRVAVIATALAVLLYVGVLMASGAPREVRVAGTVMMCGAAAITLLANRRMADEARKNFVLRLRERLRRESAEDAANRDPLTGLWNRRHLTARLAQLWAERRLQGAPTAIVMIDVDHFKAFNDRYGHPAGDLCLKRAAARMMAELRDDLDIAARYGGEEFILVLPRTGLRDAVRTAERVRAAIEALGIEHAAGGPQRIVTASFGVAAGDPATHGAAELIAAADVALYAAKRGGRNRVHPPRAGSAGFTLRRSRLRAVAERVGAR